MSDKKYRLLKAFSLKDLYVDNCPVDLFESIFSCYSWEECGFDTKMFKTVVGKECRNLPRVLREGDQWLIDNGYIEEIITETTLLKPGMLLKYKDGTIFVTEGGIYTYSRYGAENGLKFANCHFDTLEEINNYTGAVWTIL